jgi:putative protein-disulfide isomerase
MLRLIYVFDALCGWCYGFSPVMLETQRHYEGTLAVQVVSGGMVTGQRVGPIGQVAPYIKTAYKDVERATGVSFGPQFLNHTLAEGKAMFTSLPPAVALAIVREHEPERSLEFAHALQHAIYYDGIAPADTKAYLPYLKGYVVTEQDFTRKMGESSYQQLAMKDFQLSDSLKVTGFPAVFVMKEGKLHKVAEGYVAKATLWARIDALVKN